MGIKGVFGIGSASFACLTSHRIADITIGWFGEVTYEEAYLESLHSAAIYQPSVLFLFILTAFTLMIFVVSILLTLYSPLNLFVKILMLFISPLAWLSIHIFLIKNLYYGFTKCGVKFYGTVSAISGPGIFSNSSIYIFTNRKFAKRATALCREFITFRDIRIATLRDMQFEQ